MYEPARKLWELLRFQQEMHQQPPMMPWDELPPRARTIFRRAVEDFVEELLRSPARK
jgi:hypothetical protein